MLIKTRIDIVAIFLIIFSIPLLIISIVNKNADVAKKLTVLNIVCMGYLFIDICVLSSILSVDVGFRLILIYFAGLISGIPYIISLIINIVKTIKARTQTGNVTVTPKLISFILAFVIIFPVIFISSRVIRDYVIVKNSDMVLIFHSSGNGGIGQSEEFAYAVKGDKCWQFDLCIDLSIEKILPDGTEEFNLRNTETEKEVGNYKVYLHQSVIRIWNDEKLIFEYDEEVGRYFNISLEEAYIKKQK